MMRKGPIPSVLAAIALVGSSSCATPSTTKHVADSGPSACTRAGTGCANGLRYVFGVPLFTGLTLIGPPFGVPPSAGLNCLQQVFDYQPSEQPAPRETQPRIDLDSRNERRIFHGSEFY